MTTHARRFKEVILETIEASDPAPVSLEALYTAAERRISFGADDALPPMLHGKRIKEPAWKRNLRNVLQGMKDAGTLVNAQRNGWRLPSPDSSTALNPQTAWMEVRKAAEIAKDQGREFHSSQRGHRY